MSNLNPLRIMKRNQSWKGFPECESESGCAYSGRNMQAKRSNLPVEDNLVINLIIL